MTCILALTKEQSDLLKLKMPLNVVQLKQNDAYIETQILITDSVHLLTFFHTGIIIGLRNAIHNTK
jgi:hypothetical protein